MKTLFFETNGNAKLSMKGIHSPETTGIVASVFPLFQPFHAGSIKPAQLFIDILLEFGFQASTAPVIPVVQAIL